jgi:HAD superfamily hydrolase (TIGR01509 family)
MEEPRIAMDALILDMDGVLADTEPLHVRAWDLALSGLDSGAERGRLSGMSTEEIAVELVRFFNLPIASGELAERKRGIYRQMILDGLSPFPGLPAELARWRGRPLALVTSSTRGETSLMLAHMGFTGWFDPVITSDDVPRAKPAPDCYTLAMRRLGAAAAQCIVIEDSENGMRAALAAGARVLRVTPRLHPEVPGVLGLFPSTVEALQWLRT